MGAVWKAPATAAAFRLGHKGNAALRSFDLSIYSITMLLFNAFYSVKQQASAC